MANSISSLISELKKSMKILSENEGKTTDSKGNQGLLLLLLTANLLASTTLVPDTNLPKELQDTLNAFVAQDSFTSSTSTLLGNVNDVNAVLEDLITAANLIQLYFQVTQPLDQILSELVDNLESLGNTSLPPNVDLSNIKGIKGSIRTIIQDRKNLRKIQNKIFREFESDIDEKKLQDLLQRSSEILGDLKGIEPSDSGSLTHLLNATDDFIIHLQKAQELFKTFRQQGEALRDSESGEVEQLIRNWRDAIKEIEGLELNKDIRRQLNQAPEKSRQAIAQSIQIHDLLEENFSFLSDLVRSGDLVSSGIL